jgi:hypothetical protein
MPFAHDRLTLGTLVRAIALGGANWHPSFQVFACPSCLGHVGQCRGSRASVLAKMVLSDQMWMGEGPIEIQRFDEFV